MRNILILGLVYDKIFWGMLYIIYLQDEEDGDAYL